MKIRFKPIGVIHTKASDDYVKEKGDQQGELEIFPEFADGLDGGYSHLFVLVSLTDYGPNRSDR